jgi:hypothetical protein
MEHDIFENLAIIPQDMMENFDMETTSKLTEWANEYMLSPRREW